MRADEAICIDSDGEHSNAGKAARVGQSSKAAVAPLDLCVDSDDEEVAIREVPVVCVLPPSGTTSGTAAGRPAIAQLQAYVARCSPRKRKKHVDICIESDSELIGSDDEIEAIGSTSALLLTVEQQTKFVKEHTVICEVIPIEDHTVVPSQITSEPVPCSTEARSNPELFAPLPVPTSQAVDVPFAPVCEDTKATWEIQHECVNCVLSHQSSSTSGLDVTSEDPDAKLEKQAQAMAEKVLEKLSLAEEVRAKQILKVKDGILKRLKLQQSVDDSTELVGLSTDAHVVHPPPPSVEMSTFSPPAAIAEQLKPEDIKLSTKSSSPQQPVFARGLRDILALAEAQTQAFVERAIDRLPTAPQPMLNHELRNPLKSSDVRNDVTCRIQVPPAGEASEPREPQEQETGRQVELQQSLHPRSLQEFSGQSRALSDCGSRDEKAPQAAFLARRNGLRRLGKTRADRAKELTASTSGRHHNRPPPNPPPAKRCELRDSYKARKTVRAAKAEEDLESTIAFREAEREKRRALLGGSQKRPVQSHSANGWEHRRLGSSAEKRKFLRLMGGAKLAKDTGDDGSGSPLHDADLPTDCPTIELGAEGDWVPVAERGLDGEETSHRKVSQTEVQTELEQMFKRGLKQTWNPGRGLGA